MKKGLFVSTILFSIMLLGCSQNIFENRKIESDNIEITEDLISKKYYKWIFFG